ncbi:hypothetical protein [Mesorhizobium sp. LCM 4576]|nr:hypothetical protein [Mesorhizobium sp. LCM 4576]
MKNPAMFLSMALADDIRMAERHVRHGELHIARQHSLIAGLEAAGKPADGAKAFLALLEDLQMLHRAHLSRLLRRASGG